MAGANVTDAHATVDTAHDPDATGDGGAGGHGDASAHGDGHGGEPLGPIDWRAWGAGAVGAVAAVMVAGALYLTTHPG